MKIPIATVKEKHAAAGGHFFDKDVMKKHGGKVESDYIQHGFFIASEKNDEYGRVYKVRRITDNWMRVRHIYTTPSLLAARRIVRENVKKKNQEYAMSDL